jgi:hypothetical protein
LSHSIVDTDGRFEDGGVADEDHQRVNEQRASDTDVLEDAGHQEELQQEAEQVDVAEQLA